MDGLHAIPARARRETEIPEILGERCVHALLETATCRRCVDVCPQHAWRLDDESLGIDTEACDGCGLCATACRERAIVHDHQPARLNWRGHEVAFCACERTDLRTMVGVIPCIHAIGLHELLRLYREGTRALIVSTGECDACMRGQVPRLSALVNQLNELLISRDFATIGISVVPRLEWAETVLDALHEAREVRMSRRHFLRGTFGGIAEDWARLTGLVADEAEGAPPPGKLLPMSDRRGLMPFSPCIDETSCNGCDACVQVCPHGSIALEQDATGVPSRYRLDPELCTGCAICVDACDQEAIEIVQWSVQYQHEVCLENARCRACGAPYHLPVDCSMEDGRLCRICASANHYNNLYQVLD